MPGGCSSLVVVEARSPRFSSLGVTARFEFYLVAFNELHSVRESWVHGRSRTCRVYGCLKTCFNYLISAGLVCEKQFWPMMTQ